MEDRSLKHLYVKICVCVCNKVACDKAVCQRCVKNGVCVCVAKLWCDKVVCERWCVTKMVCDKDGR